MNKLSLRTRAVLAGVFIITAYGVLVSSMTESAIIIMIADVISGLSVIAIAVLLYPVLKAGGLILDRAYYALKFVEGALMIIAGVLVLFPGSEWFRPWIYDGIHLYVFIISALLLYILIQKTAITPRFIAYWGYAAVLALTLSTVLEWFNAKPAFIDYFLVLMITNEIFMALWLIIKGIDPAAAEKSALI
jgi:hypothetical protein